MADTIGYDTVGTSAFRTRARTVDHLGREQIADCPTAVSELWKNAFDAYATSVQLDIYDGAVPVAAIVDDGHGMNREEFVERWLVVGTETKAYAQETPVADRNHLEPRPRQGQKGIGRLSCANLGSTLLLVSKRRNDPFVASLVDWRLFENPFVDLSDIHVPTTEFEELGDLFRRIPDLRNALTNNIGGDDSDEARRQRLEGAWKSFDEMSDGGIPKGGSPSRFLSRELVEEINTAPFEERHLAQWPVATGGSQHGTAILISGLSYDLEVHLEKGEPDQSARYAKKRFFETLLNFVDPFPDAASSGRSTEDLKFACTARVWHGKKHREIIGLGRQFRPGQVDAMEHRIEGVVDRNGTFTGKVKAFGESVTDSCRIRPPKDVSMPRRPDSELGPFQIYVATMEFAADNTTHTPEEFQYYKDLADKYSGFMIFRDGLRVLPYGREDNDFFEIESRRSMHAGRYFWNHRQMFGRLAITRAENPNLKDKAGREGLIDNRAAKTLKALVSNILKEAARTYFGTDSNVRKERLPQISAENKRRRAQRASETLRRRLRREFRKKLETVSKEAAELLQLVDGYVGDVELRTPEQVFRAQRKLEELRDRASDLEVGDPPGKLRPVELNRLAGHRAALASVRRRLGELGDAIETRLESTSPGDPAQFLQRQLDEQAARISRRIGEWEATVQELHASEHRRIASIARERRQAFRDEASPLLRRFGTGNWSYVEASNRMDALFNEMDEKNQELFVPYISALESLRESIDLEHLATFGMEEISDLRVELERLNGLAQLGIAVEILGHELQSFDEMIGSGIRRLPEEVRGSAAVADIEFGHEGLTDQLRFLSPLRLSGPKVERWVGGNEIEEYLSDFFKLMLGTNDIELQATQAFRSFRVFDQRSRLYPVFINLVNNSIYWLSTSRRTDRRIKLDVLDTEKSEIVVSDNGPGVAAEDVDSLFTLFFTRKVQGGRGVGLYLCRANLVAGGHAIRYQASEQDAFLGGANFVISFRGAEFDGG